MPSVNLNSRSLNWGDPMKVLVFEVRGPFAHFRRVYTTTSSYSYSFPPRPAIIGLLGAILGVNSKPRASHLKKLGDIDVAVVLRKPVVKIRIPVNLISTKEEGKRAHGKRLQIPIEVIRDPEYLIFVSENNFEMFHELVQKVKKKEAVYTPCLGLSEFIASFNFVGVYEAAKALLPAEVNSVIPFENHNLRFKKGVLYLKERATRAMDENRKYLKHATYILSADASPIEVTSGENVTAVGEWNITWL